LCATIARRARRAGSDARELFSKRMRSVRLVTRGSISEALAHAGVPDTLRRALIDGSPCARAATSSAETHSRGIANHHDVRTTAPAPTSMLCRHCSPFVRMPTRAPTLVLQPASNNPHFPSNGGSWPPRDVLQRDLPRRRCEQRRFSRARHLECSDSARSCARRDTRESQSQHHSAPHGQEPSRHLSNSLTRQPGHARQVAEHCSTENHGRQLRSPCDRSRPTLNNPVKEPAQTQRQR